MLDQPNIESESTDSVSKNSNQEISELEQYEYLEKLGDGTYGTVFKVKEKVTGAVYAAKVDKLNSGQKFFKESDIIKNFDSIEGFPKMHFTGVQMIDDNKKQVIVMDLLGQSLQKIHSKYKKLVDIETTLHIGIQLLKRLEIVHDHGFVHLDIKPDNIVLGLGNDQNAQNDVLHLVDFGLSKEFKSNKGEHLPMKKNQKFVGTYRFASINTHLGLTPSRRDDLASLGYTLAYLLLGSLPWQNKAHKLMDKKSKNKLYLQMKEQISAKELFKGYPKEFRQYFDYVESLQFDDRPDYSHLIAKFE